jgi:hypothetical protein
MHHLQLHPKVSVSVVFVASLFMSIMDTTIVNVALPALGREFSVPSATRPKKLDRKLISFVYILLHSLKTCIDIKTCTDTLFNPSSSHAVGMVTSVEKILQEF